MLGGMTKSQPSAISAFYYSVIWDLLLMQMPLIAEVQHSQLPFMVGLIQQHFNEKVCCSCLTCMLQTGEVLQDVTFLLKTHFSWLYWSHMPKAVHKCEFRICSEHPKNNHLCLNFFLLLPVLGTFFRRCILCTVPWKSWGRECTRFCC